MTEFDFDCPCSKHIDLSAAQEVISYTQWFSRFHPEHENIIPGDENKVNNIVQAIPKTKTQMQTSVPQTSKIPVGVKRVQPVAQLKKSEEKNITSIKKNQPQSSAVKRTISNIVKPVEPCKKPKDQLLNNPKKPSTNTCDDDIMQMIKKHNQACAPAPLYEPARHSVRDVRRWEKETGRVWSELRPEEREKVNDEIDRMKKLKPTM